MFLLIVVPKKYLSTDDLKAQYTAKSDSTIYVISGIINPFFIH